LHLAMRYRTLRHTTPIIPYTTLFRSEAALRAIISEASKSAPPSIPDRKKAGTRLSFVRSRAVCGAKSPVKLISPVTLTMAATIRSEEHTSELQSRFDIVCRLLVENEN